MRFAHEHWAAQRKAAREALEKIQGAELLAAPDYIDAMIAGLAAGENVEPFQFSTETQRDAGTLRLIERWDQRFLEIEEEEQEER